jgi:hypothetical protein
MEGWSSQARAPHCGFPQVGPLTPPGGGAIMWEQFCRPAAEPYFIRVCGHYVREKGAFFRESHTRWRTISLRYPSAPTPLDA